MKSRAILHSLNKYGAIVFSALVLLLAASCSSGTEPAGSPVPTISFQDCQLSSPALTIHREAKCGKLKVAEDPENPSGRQIELNIAVIPAISRNPEPDPLFFLAGGPGEAATQSYLAVYSAFQLINQKRDIVLVDQRGTGGSHVLACENLSAETETEATNPQEIGEQIALCLEDLDANPAFYTTTIAMSDLDQVRQSLGYAQINLYGASYGTRAALVFARLFPEHVRSLILDGLAPPNWTLGPTVAADAQRALDMLIDRCTADPKCHAAYPDLETEFSSILESLSQEPVEVSLNHPTTGEPTQFTLDRVTFASIIHSSTYSAEGAALIPLMVHHAFTRGDYTQFAAMALTNVGTLDQTISQGMRFSVLCAEDVPFYDLQSNTSGYMGDYIPTSFKLICESWPKGEIPADFKQPVTSTAPTLLLSGESDPVTPPANGELAAQSLPNSLHLVVPGQGHVVIYRGCIAKIATQFIESGSTDGLDTTCIQEIAPMPIFLNVNGPTP